MTNKKTPHGDPLFTYEDDNYIPNSQNTNPECSLDEITEHIEKYIGKVDLVFHELVSDYLHIDVLIVNPTKEDPTYKLITSGMSDFPMVLPDEVEQPKYLELMITLPSYWKLDSESLNDENWYWPIRLIKFLARFPHDYNTFLGWGHTIGPDVENTYYSKNVKFCSSILLGSIMYEEDFLTLKINENKEILFLSVVPLYKEEAEFKINNGSDKLIETMNEYSEVVIPNRKNYCKKGIFKNISSIMNKLVAFLN